MIAKLASSGTVIGTLIPGAILVVMGIVYLVQGNHSAAPMNVHHLLPAWSGLAGLVLIVNNFLAYSGMEMNAVHVDEMKNPAREYPEVDLPRDGAGAGDLHRPGAGDLLGHPLRSRSASPPA